MWKSQCLCVGSGESRERDKTWLGIKCKSWSPLGGGCGEPREGCEQGRGRGSGGPSGRLTGGGDGAELGLVDLDPDGRRCPWSYPAISSAKSYVQRWELRRSNLGAIHLVMCVTTEGAGPGESKEDADVRRCTKKSLPG